MPGQSTAQPPDRVSLGGLPQNQLQPAVRDEDALPDHGEPWINVTHLIAQLSL
jgi:hypothetical protein